MKYFPLGQLLLQEELITQEQLDHALDHQKVSKQRLGEVMVSLDYITEKELNTALSRKLEVEFIEAPLMVLDENVAKLIPEPISRKYTIVGLYVKQGSLVMATSDPLNFEAIEDVSMITGFNVETVISYKSEIEKAINRVYSSDVSENLAESLDLDETGKLTQKEMEEINMVQRVDAAPIVKLVNSIINEAYQLNASDIHIEPEEVDTRIRFRIDGDLRIYNTINKGLHNLVVTRIKLIAGMNIAERRVPQDGSFKFSSDYVKVDMRVSTIPTPYGEKVVMRLLGADKNITYDLNSLGLSGKTLDTIQKAIRVPHGIFLVTGPTGSGKTTTLYSILDILSDDQHSVVTVEDPIERNFEGITQVQTNTKAGLTFANALRSILRQDPDIIMVGEIRDGETADIAIRAAITGHFVLSTIHTNDALSTIPRLVDMGVEPYMVASSLRCVVAQRLVKRVCPHCKEAVEVKQEDNLLLKTELTSSYKGAGCPRCNNTGYLGRIAAFEVVLVDGKLQDMISNRATMEQMQNYVNSIGTRTLRDDLVDYVIDGTTSVEEAVRILYNID